MSCTRQNISWGESQDDSFELVYFVFTNSYGRSAGSTPPIGLGGSTPFANPNNPYNSTGAAPIAGGGGNTPFGAGNSGGATPQTGTPTTNPAENNPYFNLGQGGL